MLGRCNAGWPDRGRCWVSSSVGVLRGSWGPGLLWSGGDCRSLVVWDEPQICCHVHLQAPAGRVGMRISRDAAALEELDLGILVWSSGGRSVSADFTGPLGPFWLLALLPNFFFKRLPCTELAPEPPQWRGRSCVVPGESRLIPWLLHQVALEKS